MKTDEEKTEQPKADEAPKPTTPDREVMFEPFLAYEQTHPKEK